MRFFIENIYIFKNKISDKMVLECAANSKDWEFISILEIQSSSLISAVSAWIFLSKKPLSFSSNYLIEKGGVSPHKPKNSPQICENIKAIKVKQGLWQGYSGLL